MRLANSMTSTKWWSWTSPSVQLERLMARNGLSREDAQARIAAQASRAERLAAADYVIENSGSFERTRIQVEELWRLLTEQP